MQSIIEPKIAQQMVSKRGLSKRGRIYFLLRGWRRLITIFLGFF